MFLLVLKRVLGMSKGPGKGVEVEAEGCTEVGGFLVAGGDVALEVAVT